MQSTLLIQQTNCSNVATRSLSKTSALAGKPLIACSPLPLRAARQVVRVAADKDLYKEDSLKKRRTVRIELGCRPISYHSPLWCHTPLVVVTTTVL